MTWPLALIDLIAVFVIHAVVEARDEKLDALWAVVSLLVVGPYVVRSALAQRYSGYEISPPVTWQQSLKVMWLLAWRSEVLGLAAIMLVSSLLSLAPAWRASVTTTDPLVNNIGLSLVDAVSNLLFYPLLIPAMLCKRYRGFHLSVRKAA